ncbi:single-stranded DNA-binding protein 4 [Varanus komodoensis]|uniref:single-stranded DNA-binding protein 4 n=1 Tax=Varanus komodoensis TaxID=61221 RepID=UPI001CF7834A|nr:single-stranded DNA-binding protein 4 [Varanus komodoensis]
MHAKGKGPHVPSDGQAREKLALYVYEYLLHIGAQKSAQTFLSEVRWEKNITLGEPPGFLHSWWCVFWDLYCAAPDRRDVCEHPSEAKPFRDYSAAAATMSPVMSTMQAGDGLPAGPMPPGFFQAPRGSQLSPHAQPLQHNPSTTMMGPHNQPFVSSRFPGGLRPPLRMPAQPPVGVPAPQPLIPTAMDPGTRLQGHPNMAPMQRMTPPRAMTSLALQHYGGGMRPSPGMATVNTGPAVRSPWPNMNTSSVFSSSPSSFGGTPGGGGLPSTPLAPSPGDSTNSSESMYMMSSVGPAGSRPSFSMGPSPEGPMPGMNTLEPHRLNGSLGPGDMDGMPKNSPGGVVGLANPLGTPRDDSTCSSSEAGSGFLAPLRGESYSPSMTV